MNKRNILVAFLTIILIASVIIITKDLKSKSLSNIGGSSAGSDAFIRDVIGSSASYVTGSSTKILSTGLEYDQVLLNITLVPGTTTATTYSITPYFSDTINCAASTTDSSINWYSQTAVSASGTTNTITEPVIYNFVTTATTSKQIQLSLKNLGAACIKLVTGTGNASTTQWVEGLVKQN